MTALLRTNLLVACLALLAAASHAFAQEPDLRLPISLDAESTSYDGRSSMLMFRGLRLSQGPISIQADEGRASNLDFANSVWQFAGNVIMDIENGHIECDSADLRFEGHELQEAIISGSPATFELTRPGSDVVTYAEAGRLVYDLRRAVIRFSDDATITEGGNRISSEYLVYDIEQQRINARSGVEGDSRVRITYTPRDSDDDEDDADQLPSARDDEGAGDEPEDRNDER